MLALPEPKLPLGVSFQEVTVIPRSHVTRLSFSNVGLMSKIPPEELASATSGSCYTEPQLPQVIYPLNSGHVSEPAHFKCCSSLFAPPLSSAAPDLIALNSASTNYNASMRGGSSMGRIPSSTTTTTTASGTGSTNNSSRRVSQVQMHPPSPQQSRPMSFPEQARHLLDLLLTFHTHEGRFDGTPQQLASLFDTLVPAPLLTVMSKRTTRTATNAISPVPRAASPPPSITAIINGSNTSSYPASPTMHAHGAVEEGDTHDSVQATVVAVALMETRLSLLRQEWCLIADKARLWLTTHDQHRQQQSSSSASTTVTTAEEPQDHRHHHTTQRGLANLRYIFWAKYFL